MSEPFVTVIIPCHNHEKWVDTAINSVITQDYQNKRIVFIDDGSKDFSMNKVFSKIYKPRAPERQTDPFIAAGKINNSQVEVMLFRFKESHGPSFARNWGMAAAWKATDIFTFLDCDDIYLPQKISKSVAKIMEMPQQIGVVYTDYDSINEETGLIIREYKEPFSRERLLQECIINSQSMVSKAAIEQCGKFDESLRVCEDYDLWVRVTEKFIAVHIPEVLVIKRVGDHSSTAQVKNEIWQSCYRRVFDKTRERLAR